jgi:carbamoyltransferase
MGLAPYGNPIYVDLILSELIELREDGSFRLNMDYFNFASSKKMFTPKLEKLLQSAREPESELTQLHKDIAASTQVVLDRAVLGLTRAVYNETKIPNLCLAGGVALNCVSNSKILEDGLFEKVWVQPAAGDAGGALGAALAAHSLHFKKPRYWAVPDALSYSYLGTEYSPSEIAAVLKQEELVFSEESEEQLIEKVSRSLQNGMSIGWFQGVMEFGPRALGSRSILADARDPQMQKKLNLQIKFRESFRPFAPVVLEEQADDWFDFPQNANWSPYMLFVAQVRPGREIPAVTHLDRSARVQTVNSQQNPRLHKLMKNFAEHTQCPVLINTSFNVRGEPLVESPQDAIRCFFGTDLDILVLDRFIITKSENPDRQNQYREQMMLD